MIISFVGLQSVEISELDTVNGILEIKLFEDSIAYKHPPSHPDGIRKFGFASFVQFDFLFKDFGAFEPLLGSHNTDLMNKSSGTVDFGFTGTYKRFNAGFNFGFLSAKDNNNDLVDIEFNTTQYGLHVGYNLVNSNRFIIAPMAAVKWNRFRLINRHVQFRISHSNGYSLYFYHQKGLFNQKKIPFLAKIQSFAEIIMYNWPYFIREPL